MNVLIICQYFPPENKIGAVRPSKLAKYLSRYDNMKVSVLTVAPLDIDASILQKDYCGANVYRVTAPAIVKRLNNALKANASTDYNNNVRNAKHDNNVPSCSIKRRLRSFLYSVRESVLDIAYYSEAKKWLNNNDNIYDVVITTYNTEFGHKVGLWYKKKHPDIKWITDYRDPLWGAYSTPKQINHGKKFVKRISSACDVITVVSKGIIDIHNDDFCGKPVFTIYNGYDSEDPLPNEMAATGNTVQMIYTGELYNGKRDLTPLFQAILELQKEKRIHTEDIEIVYAGKSGDTFTAQISRFSDIMYKNLGFISRQEALALQYRADILLLASWCEPNEKKVLPGKLYEYYQMKKPIICLISGNASGCRLTQIINEHTLGFSYEAANKEPDHNLLCNYIDKQVKTKKIKGFVDFIGDDEYVKQFDYKYIADGFYKIIID